MCCTAATSRAVLFDADGVLVDSHRGYATVWHRWARLHHLDPSVVLAATHARRPVDTITDVAPHLDAIAEHARLVDYVNELPDAFPVYPDAAPLLQRLPPHRWAVVTSGDAVSVRARLTAGALPLPAVLIDGHAVERGKPDPQGYLLAAAKLGSAPADCVVVEDAPAGVEAARSAGMQVVAVTTSHPATDLHGADVIVESLSQAQPDLLRWMGLEPSA
jgi:sugar-phosphatase